MSQDHPLGQSVPGIVSALSPCKLNQAASEKLGKKRKPAALSVGSAQHCGSRREVLLAGMMRKTRRTGELEENNLVT